MTTVPLPADMGIETATDLKDLLAPALTVEGPVQLDGQAVSRLHCASLQLLAAFVLARNALGQSTDLAPSPALSQAIDLLGLQSLLGTAATTSVH